MPEDSQQSGQQQPQTPSGSQAPPWGTEENFDPQRAWSLIQNLRSDNERLQQRPAITEDQQRQLGEYEQWRQQNQTEQQRQAEQLQRSQSETAQWRDVALSSRVQALAADFADPSDAAGALGDMSRFVTPTGQIRDDAIRAELAAVLERKPHWRRQAEQPDPRLPWPNPAQGTGGTPPVVTGTDQMNQMIRSARSGT